MSDHTFHLSVGQRVVYDGETWSVKALSGHTVQLARPVGSPLVMRVSDLLAGPGFGVAGDIQPPAEALGPTFGTLGPDGYRDLRQREEHILETLTGFRRGSAELRLAWGTPTGVCTEPAVEAAVRSQGGRTPRSTRTLRRLAADYTAEGLSGLISGHAHRRTSPTGRVDARWIDMARQVLAEHVDASQPTVQLVIDRTNARVLAAHGDEVKIPGKSTAHRVLKEITKGQQAFSGTSAKQKRSIAGRPQAPYGRLRAQRVGQYILLGHQSTGRLRHGPDHIAVGRHAVDGRS